jgi:hypothetical protein
MINVWLIKHSTAGGSSYLNEAYTNEQACKEVCIDLNRCADRSCEGYIFEASVGEPIPDERIIINRTVYKINDITPDGVIYQRAIKKLSKEELEVVIKVIKGMKL